MLLASASFRAMLAFGYRLRISIVRLKLAVVWLLSLSTIQFSLPNGNLYRVVREETWSKMSSVRA